MRLISLIHDLLHLELFSYNHCLDINGSVQQFPHWSSQAIAPTGLRAANNYSGICAAREATGNMYGRDFLFFFGGSCIIPGRAAGGSSFWGSSSKSRSFSMGGAGRSIEGNAWLRAEWVREMNAVCKKAGELRWRGGELFIHSNEAVGGWLVGNWTWSISPLSWRWRCV